MNCSSFITLFFKLLLEISFDSVGRAIACNVRSPGIKSHLGLHFSEINMLYCYISTQLQSEQKKTGLVECLYLRYRHQDMMTLSVKGVMGTSQWQILSHNVVSSTPPHDKKIFFLYKIHVGQVHCLLWPSYTEFYQ
jgi:hypothetical protein